MIGYVMLGTNDIGRARAFYEPLLGLLEMRPHPAYRSEGREWYAPKGGAPLLAVGAPGDGGPASVGNGVMMALAAPSRDLVGQVHAKALELGGTDEGAPGPRGAQGFYGAYFRDPDGNKFCVFHHGAG